MNVQPDGVSVAVASITWMPVPSGSAIVSSSSGRGTQNVMMPVSGASCMPVIVPTLMTPGAGGSEQSLATLAIRSPNVSVTCALDAVSPYSSAPASWRRRRRQSGQRSLRGSDANTGERHSKRDMGHHRVAESVVLDDVLEHALERAPAHLLR